MYIPGINVGIGASVCLLNEGRIVLSIQEERPRRIKNFGEFPELFLKFVHDNYADLLKNINYVAICDKADRATTHK